MTIRVVRLGSPRGVPKARCHRSVLRALRVARGAAVD